MSEQSTSRLPIWLIVSLIVNALLIGLNIGGGLGNRRAGPPAVVPGAEQALIRGIDRSIPAEQRDDIRQAFRRAFTDSRRERVEVRNAQRSLARLLAAEDYDAAAVQRGFADLREAEAAMKAKMHDVLSEKFGTLNAQQRRAIIQQQVRNQSRNRQSDRGDRRPRDNGSPPRD